LKNLARIDQLLGWSHNFLGFLIINNNKKKEKSNSIKEKSYWSLILSCFPFLGKPNVGGLDIVSLLQRPNC
jgi:hypothetical protein